MTSLERALRERILVLDGATGTEIQKRGLAPDEYRGTQFADHPNELAGNSDVLCLTRPDVVEAVHRDYFAAGADMVETNTFNANRLSQSDYGLEAECYRINAAAARIARRVADEVAAATHTQRFVLGSMGPTNRTASISPKVEDPGFRDVTFDALAEAYGEQARGLADGGADAFLVETVFDTLNAKAALWAVDEVNAERVAAGQAALPLIVSVTLADKSGRTLSGQTLAAFCASVAHARPLMMSLNCAFGIEQLKPHIEELATLVSCAVMCFPNAGLPNAMGEYDETPEDMARQLRELATAGKLNAVGGCCGTTPAHIAAIAAAVKGCTPRAVAAESLDAADRVPGLALSGLESVRIGAEGSLFTNVGERCNVAGSRRFARLIREEKYDDALAVARDQVEAGALVLDVNVDEGMLDSAAVMTRFLNLMAAEPDIARVPIMVDSSKFAILEAGMKCCQGRCIVNSLSLKQGEEQFVEQARIVRRAGAAVVVMAFDEEGQAATAERKFAICERAYKLLTGPRVGFRANDIVFDPNVLTVATGMPEHDNLAVEFFESCRRIRANLPGALVSGGLSNVSFSFRGVDTVREAMHSVFLYHGIAAGMGLGIVNAGRLPIYSDIEPDLLAAVSAVVLNQGDGATEKLLAMAEGLRGAGGKASAKAAVDSEWLSWPAARRLTRRLVRGLGGADAEADALQARLDLGSGLAVIEGPMMTAMGEVGDLFGSGRMFLPQVIKSARVMKSAVAVLLPYIEEENKDKPKAASHAARRVVLATVKGDVHDIGKNIVKVVLGCSGYDVIDMGINVRREDIVAKVKEVGAQAVGLSGLITPSLDEMAAVAAALEAEGVCVPMLVGGAATSEIHTAVKIAPRRPSAPVIHADDASYAVVVCNALTRADRRARGLGAARYAAETARQYTALAKRHAATAASAPPLVALADARASPRRAAFGPTTLAPPPRDLGMTVFADYPLAEAAELIDWAPLFQAYGLRGRGATRFFPELLDDPTVGAQARELHADAQAMLRSHMLGGRVHARAIVGLYPARACCDDIVLFATDADAAAAAAGAVTRETPGVIGVFHGLRQQARRPDAAEAGYACVSDHVLPLGAAGSDYVGVFVVTAGAGMPELLASLDSDDDGAKLLCELLADRLVEACAEHLHRKIRQELWGYAGEEALTPQQLVDCDYRGIRPAPGYPSQPDHREKREIWRLLDVERRIGMTLTESCAMSPAASICALVLAHPDAEYFAVDRIGRDQAEDYAARTGQTVAETEQWLAPVLAYDPERRA